MGWSCNFSLKPINWSGNQTWQWKIPLLFWVISLFHWKSGCPVATFDYRRVSWALCSPWWQEIIGGARNKTHWANFPAPKLAVPRWIPNKKWAIHVPKWLGALGATGNPALMQLFRLTTVGSKLWLPISWYQGWRPCDHINCHDTEDNTHSLLLALGSP